VNLATYLDSLRTRLAGKDPRRLPGNPRGRIVFVFKELEGTQRATIEFGRTISVREGAIDDDDAPCAFIFGRLDDWLAFFEDFNKERMNALDFYGDLWLVKLLPELTHQKMSPLNMRLSQ
jgi:hypothetical protein